jgi:hypothetical protein
MYGYCRGVRSSRQIERLCGTDVAFRVLCAQDVPDHCTLARFRADCQDGFTSLFTQVLMIAGRAGMARFGTVAIDGTKIAANASIDANRPSLNDLGHLCRHGASSAAWTVGASPWRLPLPDTRSHPMADGVRRLMARTPAERNLPPRWRPRLMLRLRSQPLARLLGPLQRRAVVAEIERRIRNGKVRWVARISTPTADGAARCLIRRSTLSGSYVRLEHRSTAILTWTRPAARSRCRRLATSGSPRKGT